MVPSGVLLFGAMGRQSCRSAGALILELLFFGALFFDDLLADVSIVVVSFVFTIVDVSVAKVMTVFWPGYTADIEKRRAGCHTCNRIAPSQQ